MWIWFSTFLHSNCDDDIHLNEFKRVVVSTTCTKQKKKKTRQLELTLKYTKCVLLYFYTNYCSRMGVNKEENILRATRTSYYSLVCCDKSNSTNDHKSWYSLCLATNQAALLYHNNVLFTKCFSLLCRKKKKEETRAISRSNILVLWKQF